MIDWLIRFAKRTPFTHLDGYMNRYWLVRQRKWLPFSIRIHEILRSDEDRHLHDHPWRNISIVLRGGYTEVTPTDQAQPAERDWWSLNVKWRGPGSIVFRKATDRHRLVLTEGKTCWTIFIMLGNKRQWGFHTQRGWIHWKDYENA